MNGQIGVFDAPPLYAIGLSRALGRTMFSIESVRDLTTWTTDHPREILLWLVREPTTFGVVGEVAERSPEVQIITVLDPITTEAALDSLRVGAIGAIGLYEPPDDVLLAIEAAERGRVILPSCVARPLVEKLSCEFEVGRLDDCDVACLRSLAGGEKVAEMARCFGYSEREMYRRLRRLYAEMGVRGRTEALLLAVRSGLID